MNQKTVLMVTLTVLVTAILVGGGTYYLLHNKAEKDNKALQTQIDELNGKIVTNDNTNTVDATVDWKSISLSKLDLAVKYPETWGEATLDAGEATDPDVHVQIYHFSLNENYSINYETAASSGVGGNMLGQYYDTTADDVAVKVSKAGSVVGGIIEHKKDMDVCDGVGCSEEDIVYGVYFKTGSMYSNIVFESLPDTTSNRTLLENMIKSISPVDATADWNTYTDTTYGFSFKYPSAWATYKVETDAKTGDNNKDMVQKITFQSKATMEVSCYFAQQGNWVSKTPTQTECKTILANLTQVRIAEMNATREGIDDIFIRISNYNSAISLESWLLSEYKIPDSELAEYSVGKAITMGGLNGFTSSIGCCSGTDFSYAVQKGKYVFELGTDGNINGIGTTRADADDSFVRTVAGTFQFTK